MAGVLEDVRAEDFVEYFIFPNHNSVSSALDEINKKVSSYVKDYIWHKDPFFLKKVEGSENNGKIFKFCFTLFTKEFLELGIPHLHGITHFGDNIEDEWFIVALLMRLTEEISDLVVR
jgi:SGT1 protein